MIKKTKNKKTTTTKKNNNKKKKRQQLHYDDLRWDYLRPQPDTVVK